MKKILISTVHKYPCIWDITSKEYRDREQKEAAWRAVVKTCNLADVKEAKTIWKSLRDGHRQVINAKKSKTVLKRSKETPWKYENSMDFLVPFMRNVEERSESIIQNPVLERFSPLDECRDSMHSGNSHTFSVEILSEDELQTSPRSLSLSNSSTPISNKVKKTKAEENLYLLLKQELNELRKERRALEQDRERYQMLLETENKKDPTEKFFSSMCNSTKPLPEDIQRTIKKTLFQAVMEGEEEAMRRKN